MMNFLFPYRSSIMVRLVNWSGWLICTYALSSKKRNLSGRDKVPYASDHVNQCIPRLDVDIIDNVLILA